MAWSKEKVVCKYGGAGGLRLARSNPEHVRALNALSEIMVALASSEVSKASSIGKKKSKKVILLLISYLFGII